MTARSTLNPQLSLESRNPPPRRETSAPMNALPSRKPNRRRRLALRFAVLVAAISALGAAYWFTRRPELVWWRSPEIDYSSRHVRILAPRALVAHNPPSSQSPDLRIALSN